MKYTISEGKPEEFDHFYKVFQKSLREQFPQLSKNAIAFYLDVAYFKNLLKKQINKEYNNIFLARDIDSNIVGYLLTLQDFGGVNCALWMGVKKDHQGKGIASQLLKIWEEFALKEKNHALLLFTTKENIKFYKNRGFKQSGKLPKFWFGVDSYVFYKNIATPKEENYLFDYLKK